MSKPTKNVLQQSNCNLDPSKEDDRKPFFPSRIKDETSFETENLCGPQKKSDAKKLRSVRLDLSSLKRGVIRKADSRGTEASSDDSGEEETKKKRKQRPVVPNYVTNSESGPCRKPRQSRQDPLALSSQSHLAKSQPQSIARRNARERNRVKQVNEGFATLRDRIPEYISEAYNEEKGRKVAKKLSKVETLRMAVDYIRHLETLLDLRSTRIDGESEPWGTPASSGEYPSPKCRPPCAASPAASYEQAFDYQDRIFYDYDLELPPRKESPPREESPAAFVVLSLGGNGVEYYETFNRLKKETGESVEEEENLENLDVSRGDSKLLPGAKEAVGEGIKKATVLPPITESFGKGIPVFF